MSIPNFRRATTIMVVLVIVLSLFTTAVSAKPQQVDTPPISFTLLHTNDFHGQLEASATAYDKSTGLYSISNPGAARVAYLINQVRASKGDSNVLVFDGGDMMQGSLLSNLQKGQPTIAYYRTAGFNAATFGNHEFDWGQTVLGDRIAQAEAAATATEKPMQMIVANITKKDSGGACTWEPFNPSVAPYEVFTVAGTVRVGVIGVGSVETPYITIASATDGLCFRDPAESILHYYDALDAASDVIVVLSHNGYTDGGYGYGFTVYGDQTLAQKLITAGKPANLIIGGHSHTNITPPPAKVGNTTVVQAYYNGRQVGQADMTYDPDNGEVTLAWSKLAPKNNVTDPSLFTPEDPAVKALVTSYTSDPAYQAKISEVIGWSQVDMLRNYNGDNLLGDFIDDAIYNWLNNDADGTNDVDMFFNNAGGLRADLCATSTCTAGLQAEPFKLTYGMMFNVLPFGNATAVGKMTGAQIMELLNQSATLFKGALQPAGIRYNFYRYTDALPGPQPYAWGAYDVQVWDKDSDQWVDLELAKTYSVGTNEFLAPAGQDGYLAFKYMTNITYWGDMLNAVNDWVKATYTETDPYKGPNADGMLDGRITRDGNGNDNYDAGEVVPVTILHHNDSHGRLAPAGTTPGYTNLATIIKQERAHNSARTLLVSGGDNIQGDSMMYYFKSAGLGYSADGNELPENLQINPLIKAFNSMGYDAMTLGNHEFNFGSEIFRTLKQANFPLLQANVSDTGEYGLDEVGVLPSITKTVGPEGIKVAILGIGNHRVPSYELPSNIVGLTFSDPIVTGQDLAPQLQAESDAVIALTHIGFTEDPKSVEVDKNVDTTFAKLVPGVDAIIGAHSHTNPASGFAGYKWLPTFEGGPDNAPVIISQAYRYNTNLGEIVLGMLPDGMGGYEVVSRSGRYIPITTSVAEDADVKTIVSPYQTLITDYNNTVIGSTTVPIDTNEAFTKETNGANLQADASVWKLEEDEGIAVDFHLSGAMTNRKIADTATPQNPYQLKVSDMFAAMPYENSLVVMEINGPQLKAILERAYRNYYYYKYVPGYGGYSYYTTCMLDTDFGNQIVYQDTAPVLPDGNNVVAFWYGDKKVDFTDATTYYRVSSVNYLAAGACNFSDNGKTLWPLDQIVADTQYYVRDAVIEYTQAQTEPISPMVEGRLAFLTAVDTEAPTIVITTPAPANYWHQNSIILDFSVTDTGSGVKVVMAKLDNIAVSNGQVFGPYALSLGEHTFTVQAIDKAGNEANAQVKFNVVATVKSLKDSVDQFYKDGQISKADVYKGLMDKLIAAENSKTKNTRNNALNAFINLVNAQTGKAITADAAALLIADAQWVMSH